ncbi:NHL repeat-containing protein [Kibdelosporangium aridum]|uniref:Sugar lactone lactonase YvrE n=1 Tax=Kibdelosporangium aridum TaxID=2030 RepID=A0A1W2EQC1_KIBAR|nr:SMP-30/gluconolactonase/LRE family protein [Kibdelosporangium aridum]SMD11732.1 Sugar lactone lactonase YvrE [Kibdelosporangium aridum]
MSPFRGSNGIAFGPDGRLYVAEYLGGRISAIDLATTQVEIAVPADGPVQSPDDLAFGADGSMYITDLVPGRVWRRDPHGDYTLVSDEVKVPNGIACVGDRLFVNEMRVGGRLLELFPDGREPVVLAEGLMLGNAMQLGPDGCLYYPHMLTNEVFRIPLDGGTPELVAEDVHEPVAVRFDREGVLMVLSRGVDGIVTRIDQGQRKIITTGVMCLDNAAFDSDNRMYVSSYASGGIAEVHPDGRTRQVVPEGLAGPYGVTVDTGGAVYTADHYRVVKPTGPELAIFTHGIVAAKGQLHVTSQYGDVRTDGTTRASGLNRPMGIAVRDDGALVVAEAGAGRVIAIDTEVTVVASGFTSPMDVAFDAEQRCYVSDETGAVHRIDDGVAIASGLAAPQGLAVHGDELFVVEVGLHRVLAIHLQTGERRVVAADLPLSPERPRELFVHGMPGCPRRFVGLAVAPDGSLHVSGDGTVLRIPQEIG